MKNILFILTLIAIFWAVDDNVYSQCPPGFSGPYTTIISLCDTNECQIEVEWCCNEDIGPYPLGNIHIQSIRFLMDPFSIQSGCGCIQWMGQQPPSPPLPAIPFDKMLDGIINSGRYCNNDLPFIPPCEPPGSTKKIKVTYGGCYQWVSSFDFIGYRPCEPTSEPTTCHQDYDICIKLVNGKFVIETVVYGDATPQFECESGCMPICNFITY